MKNKFNRVFVTLMDGVKVSGELNGMCNGEKTADENFISAVKKYVENLMGILKYRGEEISIMFCNDEKIHELNKQYRNIDSATDVLSFENGEKYEDEEGEWMAMGDIVISLEILPKNAEYFSVSQEVELKRLILHGLLHLNGYDHGEEHIEKGVMPKCKMLVKQEKILRKIGVL